MHQYLKIFDTIRLYAPWNIFWIFSYILQFLSSNLELHQILQYVDFFSQMPVTGLTSPVYRSKCLVIRNKPVEYRVWFGNLNLSGFFGNHSKRSSKPLPEAIGLVLRVDKKTLILAPAILDRDNFFPD
jgi:hypothetical protein